MISNRAIIHPNVILGKGCVIEDFAIIGAPPRGYQSGDLETFIGDNAIIRSHAVIYAGNKIGNDFQVGNKANIREINEIGDNVSIGTLSVVEHHVTIGNGVRIHTQVFVPEYCILEDDCWLGPNVVLTNAKYPRSIHAKESLHGVVVKKNAKIGANVTILPGVIIGENSLIGSGSVVTKNVSRGAVMTGNPAKFSKDISKIKDYDSSST